MRFGQPNKRKHRTDECIAFDICRLARAGLLDHPFTGEAMPWTNLASRLKATIRLSLVHCADGQRCFLLEYTLPEMWPQWLSEQVLLQGTRPYLGGVRWWFTCPACARRVRLLYLPPGKKRFLCRRCHDLAYQTQLRDKRERALSRAMGIRFQLGGRGFIVDHFPWKLPGMHWKRYQRMRRQAEEAELKWFQLATAGMKR